jgi:hypothetical protein
MTKQEIIAQVKTLGLPEGSYIVFGSGPLAAAEIREAGDVDLYVTTEVLDELIQRGWQQTDKDPKDRPYTSGIFEAHANWDFSPYAPTLEHLLASAHVIEDVPFASLEEVRKWKEASGGTKHDADIKLIDEYLSKREDI